VYGLISLHHSLLCRYTGEMPSLPISSTWCLPPETHMGSSTNPQHNCSGARYIWLCCVWWYQNHMYTH